MCHLNLKQQEVSNMKLDVIKVSSSHIESSICLHPTEVSPYLKVIASMFALS